MTFFSYIALNEKGRRIKGNMTAANEVDLEHRLKELGLDVIELRILKEKTGSIGRASVSLKDIIILCIHLEQLERAGVPLLDSIADLRDTTDSIKVKNLMAEIYDSVRSGSMLSAAMASHPQVFNEVFTGLVAAGERTGQLADIFHHLGHHLKWVHDIRGKIKKATYYPMFLLALMAGIVSMMMLFVIPKLSGFLKAQNIELPIYTKLLISFSDFFANYWYVLLIVPVAIFIFIKTMCKSSSTFAYHFDNFKLCIPAVGMVIRKIELARFCHFFAITFKSGIGILDCLDIAHNVVDNRVIKESISTARRAVSEGSSLTTALRVSNQFPSLVIRMFKVGEDSGNLDTTLANITFFYDREVNESVNNMVGVVQPALTIILGGIMLWVSVAVFGPLYGSFSKMKF